MLIQYTIRCSSVVPNYSICWAYNGYRGGTMHIHSRSNGYITSFTHSNYEESYAGCRSISHCNYYSYSGFWNLNTGGLVHG